MALVGNELHLKLYVTHADSFLLALFPCFDSHLPQRTFPLAPTSLADVAESPCIDIFHTKTSYEQETLACKFSIDTFYKNKISGNILNPTPLSLSQRMKSSETLTITCLARTQQVSFEPHSLLATN